MLTFVWRNGKAPAIPVLPSVSGIVRTWELETVTYWIQTFDILDVNITQFWIMTSLKTCTSS
jgi:hypothetical protein